jgi:hypothetical protein
MKLFQLIVGTLFMSVNLFASISEVSAKNIPEVECREALGSSACGYNCETSLDGKNVQCAEWPGGKCKATLDSVACGPPAPSNWESNYKENECSDDNLRSQLSSESRSTYGSAKPSAIILIGE